VEWQIMLAAFLFFRLFDIWKPFPIRLLEKLPGGWGIMADDWLAGIYAALLLRLALHFNVL
jgi:phosphatidylglycerophosphatase A